MSVVVRSFVSPLALDVPRSRWFRFPFSLVRVRCGFWSPRVAAASSVLYVGSRLVLVLVLRVWPLFWSCGGFVFFPFGFFIGSETTVNPFLGATKI